MTTQGSYSQQGLISAQSLDDVRLDGVRGQKRELVRHRKQSAKPTVDVGSGMYGSGAAHSSGRSSASANESGADFRVLRPDSRFSRSQANLPDLNALEAADAMELSGMMRSSASGASRSHSSSSRTRSLNYPFDSSTNSGDDVHLNDVYLHDQDDAQELDLSDLMQRADHMVPAAPTLHGQKLDTDFEMEASSASQPRPQQLPDSRSDASHRPQPSGSQSLYAQPPQQHAPQQHAPQQQWPPHAAHGQPVHPPGTSHSDFAAYQVPPGYYPNGWNTPTWTGSGWTNQGWPQQQPVSYPELPQVPQTAPAAESGAHSYSTSESLPPSTFEDSGHTTRHSGESSTAVAVTLPAESDAAVLESTSSIDQTATTPPVDDGPTAAELLQQQAQEERAAKARQTAQLMDLFRQRLAQATQNLLEQREPLPDQLPRSLEKLIAKLKAKKSKDTERIVSSLAQIAKTQEPTAVEILSEYSVKGPMPVRAAGISGLALIDHAAARLALLKLLKDSNPEIVDLAIRGLLQSETIAAVPSLVCLSVANSRYAAVLATELQELPEDGRELMTQALQAEMTNKPAACAAFAIVLLAKLDAQQQLKPALKLVRHPAAEIRVAALEALALSKKNQTVRFFNASMRDPDARVRAAAANALSVVASPKSASLLIAALRDPQAVVRRSAAKTLSILPDPKSEIAAAASKAVSAQNDPQTMEYLLEIIGKGGTDDALETLQRYLDQDILDLRHRAISTLRKLKNPKAAAMLKPFLNGGNPVTRELAVRAVGTTGDKSVLPVLRQLLKNDQDEKVRSAAARTLGELNDRKSSTALEESFHDSRNVATQAVIALGLIGDKSSLPGLFSQLRNTSSDIRYHACNSIAQIGAIENLDKIVELLDDREPMVKRAAEQALGKLGYRPSGAVRAAQKIRRAASKAGVALMPLSLTLAIPGGTTGLLAAGGGLVLTLVGVVAFFLMDAVGTPGRNLPVTRVSAIAVSPDANFAWASRSNKVAEVWDLKEGKLLDRFKTPFFSKAVFSTSGDAMLMFGMDGVVKHQLAERYSDSLESQQTEIGAVSAEYYAADGKNVWLAVRKKGQETSQLLEYDLATLEPGRKKELNMPVDRAFALSPNLDMAVVPQANGLWLFTGEALTKADRLLELQLLIGKDISTGDIRDASFNADGSLLAVACTEVVVVLELPKGSLKTVLFREEVGRDELERVRFVDDSNKLVAVSISGSRFVATNDFQKTESTKGKGDGYMATYALSPDVSTAVFSKDTSKDLQVLDLSTGAVVKNISGKL